VAVGARRCAATTASLSGLLVEVVAPAAVSGTDSSYLLPITDASLDGPAPAGLVLDWQPSLPASIEVSSGRVLAPPGLEGSPCVGADGSIPSKVELQRRLSLGGELVKSYTAETVDTITAEGVVHRLAIEVPPDSYDLYIVPAPCDAGDVPPPQFVSDVVITSDSTLEISLAEGVPLAGVVVPPAELASLDGWWLDVVEPVRGRAISRPVRLADLGLGEVPFHTSFGWFSADAVPIVRVRPPTGTLGDPTCAAACGGVCSVVSGQCLVEGACLADGDCGSGAVCVNGSCRVGARATAYSSLDVLALSGNTEAVVLDLTELPASLREVSGQIVAGEGGAIPAVLEWSSTSLGGSVPAGVTLTSSTAESGVFSAFLPPGVYQVVATSDDPTLALGARSFELQPGAECFCGQSVVLPSRGEVSGSVLDQAGRTLSSGRVVASPVFRDRTYVDAAFGSQSSAARTAESALQGGRIALGLDPGRFDLSVRPGAEALPFWVRSGFAMPDEGDLALGELRLPAGVFLRGELLAASGESVPTATLRAWLPISNDGEESRALLVGEAVVTSGAFVLALPASRSGD
jgi:hypothetical protein